ncbi:hypothetical protein ACQFN5_27950 [Klebsiella sp. WOUb02]|uniref:DUF7736 domain-containing protein n=1 Tax=Klebsiella sp. WOUb02 TaxID=3161071 RepID=UPI003CF0F9DC
MANKEELLKKSKREVELEIELYSTRNALLNAHMQRLSRDKEENDNQLAEAKLALVLIRKEENKAAKGGVKKLTQEQALIISGFTGYLACSAETVKADVEKRLGEPMGDITLAAVGQDKISALYKDDYAKLCPYAHPESDNRLTDEQAIIVTGYTGMLLGDVDKFYADLEKRLGRKIVNSELPSIGQEKISELYREDFRALAI